MSSSSLDEFKNSDNHVHSKKGIVISTSGLLYEFQTSEARAKLVSVCVLREFIRNVENTLAMSKLMHC